MTARLEPIELLHVEMELAGEQRSVGRLARRAGRIYFEYDPAFAAEGRSISPLLLPLGTQVFAAESEPFDGLYGVFNDSLPDGWGRLLLDRRLGGLGLTPSALTPLDRLAYVGHRGLGALRYRPEIAPVRHREAIDLDALAAEIQSVLDGDAEDVLDHLIELGGSSGGARPKVLVGCNESRKRLVAGVDELAAGFSHWLVKFRSSSDPIDIGAVEYAYAQMARAAGIEMEPTHLFPAGEGPGYFGTQRFDRRGRSRFHVHTICGLLHADHRLPSIGYDTLLKATRLLTRNQLEVDKMFRRMVFNVLAYNRDDHTKNHAFLLEEDGQWCCTPAYDLTFSSGPGGEHALAIAGEGRDPRAEHLELVAKQAGVSAAVLRGSLADVKAAIARWPSLAAEAGVSSKLAKTIDLRLNGPRRRGKAASATGAARKAKPRAKAATKPRAVKRVAAPPPRKREPTKPRAQR
jgi:serine/threonine-protein kinase HipA